MGTEPRTLPLTPTHEQTLRNRLSRYQDSGDPLMVMAPNDVAEMFATIDALRAERDTLRATVAGLRSGKDEETLRQRAEVKDRAENRLRFFWGHYEHQRQEILDTAIALLSESADEDRERAWAIEDAAFAATPAPDVNPWRAELDARIERYVAAFSRSPRDLTGEEFQEWQRTRIRLEADAKSALTDYALREAKNRNGIVSDTPADPATPAPDGRD